MGDADNSKPLGRRMLAAIMFTDIEGFSLRMELDEDGTLQRARQDFAQMKELVHRWDGKVIKNTGDGLLCVFNSGVQAVECAQAIQKHFAERAQGAEPHEVLQHRIGIHLGDIYVNTGEVMGDGVNIASRLQDEAPAGGICISQALYEVVKTRMALQTHHVGVKQLKNIQSPVQVYQVLMNLPGERLITSDPRGGLPRLPRWAWQSAVAVLAVVGLIAIVVALSGDDEPSTPSGSGVGELPTETGTPEGYAAEKARRVAERDFAGLARWIEQQGLDDSSRRMQDEYRLYESLGRLMDDMQRRLKQYTQSSPMEVRSRKEGRIEVWTDPDGNLMVKRPDRQPNQIWLERVAGEFVVLLAVHFNRADDRDGLLDGRDERMKRRRLIVSLARELGVTDQVVDSLDDNRRGPGRRFSRDDDRRSPRDQR